LHSGIYNAGFLGISVSPEAENFLKWWGSALLEGGEFNSRHSADQTWLNCVTTYFRKTTVLMHYGYNVAFWNLDERPIDFSQNPATAGSDVLKFMHLSGILMNSTESLVPDKDYFKFNKELADETSLPFMKDYRNLLNRLMALQKMPSSRTIHGYNQFDDGTPITQKVRKGYHFLRPYPYFENPFSAEHKKWLFSQFEPTVFQIIWQKAWVF
jgi:hypothetical protein